MKSDGMWVVCLNCGHQFYLEHHTKRMNTSCCICRSKEYRLVDEEEESETRDELRFLLRIGGEQFE